MNEEKQLKFKKLATQRTNAVLIKLRLLGNLSNKSNYAYSSEEVNKIFRAIDEQLRSVKAQFVHKKNKKFTL